MKGSLNHLSHKYVNPIELEIRIEAIIVVGLGITMPAGVILHITRILGAEWEIALIIEETMGITWGNQEYRNNNNYRRNSYRGQDFDRNRSRSLDRQVRGRRNDRSASSGRSRSGSRVSTKIDRIRCFKCREYDHFARECPTRWENRETEQIQQMFSLDDDQTILQTLLIDTEDDIMMITLMETRDGLNL